MSMPSMLVVRSQPTWPSLSTHLRVSSRTCISMAQARGRFALKYSSASRKKNASLVRILKPKNNNNTSTKMSNRGMVQNTQNDERGGASQVFLASSSVAWIALGVYAFAQPEDIARTMNLSVQGIDGLQHLTNLQATAPYAVLQSAVLALLASNQNQQEEDSDSLLATAGALAPAASALALAVALTQTPMESVDNVPLACYAAFAAATAALSASTSKKSPSEFLDERAEDAKNISRLNDNTYLLYFYKISTIASLVVGGSFALSPISPLAISNDPTPLAQFLRRDFGLFSIFLLAPVQTLLASAAETGTLATPTCRVLNLAVAIAIAGIDGVTLYSSKATADVLRETLPADQLAGTLDVSSLVEGSSGGIENFVGALAVSATILVVYLAQAVRPSAQD